MSPERTLTHADLEAIVNAIDLRIEDKFKLGHLCRFEERELVGLKDFIEWWHENDTDVKGFLEFYSNSKSNVFKMVWASIGLGIIFLMFLVFKGGWNPLSK